MRGPPAALRSSAWPRGVPGVQSDLAAAAVVQRADVQVHIGHRQHAGSLVSGHSASFRPGLAKMSRKARFLPLARVVEAVEVESARCSERSSS